MPWDIDPNSPTYGTWYPDDLVLPPPPENVSEPSVRTPGTQDYGNTGSVNGSIPGNIPSPNPPGTRLDVDPGSSTYGQYIPINSPQPPKEVAEPSVRTPGTQDYGNTGKPSESKTESRPKIQPTGLVRYTVNREKGNQNQPKTEGMSQVDQLDKEYKDLSKERKEDLKPSFDEFVKAALIDAKVSPKLQQIDMKRDWDQYWTALGKATQQEKEKYYATVSKAKQDYVDKYGNAAYWGGVVASEIASPLFQPARIIAPNVSKKDLTAEDWIVGGAQIAMIVAPYGIGRALEKYAGPTTRIGKAVEERLFTPKQQVSQTVKDEIIHTSDALRKNNPELVKPYQNVARAQEDYAKNLIKVKNQENYLESARKDVSKLDPTSNVDDLEARLAKARINLDKSRENLINNGSKYADRLKVNAPKVDDPTITESFNRLPQDIAKHTENVVNLTLKAKTASGETMEEMQLKLASAKQQLKTYNERNLSRIEAKNIQPERARLQKIVDEYPGKIAKEARRLSVESNVKTEEFQRWNAERNKVEEVRIRKEQESRFGGNTKTRTPPETRGGTGLNAELKRAGYKVLPGISPKGGGSATGDTKLRATTREAAAREEASHSSDQQPADAVSNRTMPTVSSKPAEVTKPDSGTQSGTRTSTQSATGTTVFTNPNISPENNPENAPGPKPETKPSTRTETKTTTKTQRGEKTSLKSSLILPGISGKEPKDRKALKVEQGSLAWRQGALEVDKSHPGPEDVFIVEQPPEYQKEVFIDRPPKGYRNKGRTPQQTIQTIGGNVKRKVNVNLGVTTAHASPDTGKISFTSNPEISRRRPSISRRIPRITPRMGKLR